MFKSQTFPISHLSRPSQRRRMLSHFNVTVRGIGAAGFMLTSSACYTRAMASDVSSFDVIGFRLGQSPAEVKQTAEKLNASFVEPITRRLMYGGFALENVVLGTRIKEGSGTPWYNATNKEFVQVNYSLNAPAKVTYINRIRYFDENSAPSRESLVASLTEKYGAPAGTEGGGTQWTWMYWISNSSYPTSGRLTFNSPLHMCGYELIADADPFGQMRNGTVSFNPQYIDAQWPKCGVVMAAKIEPLSSNNQLVHGLTVAIGDYRELQQSSHSMMDALKNGESNRISDGAAHGAVNKPPL
jgi:hypothetical protein